MRRARRLLRLPAAAWAVSIWIAGCAAEPASSPLTVVEIDRRTPDGPVRGLAARVDLSDPRVSVIVTSPLNPPVAGCEAVAMPVDAWASARAAAVAVNANFFAAGAGAAPGGACLDIIGLSIAHGQIVSPVRLHDGRPDPALLIDAGGWARIDHPDAARAAGAMAAVAGVGGSATDSVPGTLLVRDGRNLGATARVQPLARHPRTAAGASADGRTLWLVAIDGRQPDWSIGVTLPELADLMIELGASDAVNLDGGGSTSFVAREASGDTVRTNRPSDGRFRPVANHLGIVISDGDISGGLTGAGAPSRDRCEAASDVVSVTRGERR